MMSAALWQILRKIQTNQAQALDCDECFTLLEYLVSQVAEEQYLDGLYEVARKHWELCPGCREHHLQQLQALEAAYAARHGAVAAALVCRWPATKPALKGHKP